MVKAMYARTRSPSKRVYADAGLILTCEDVAWHRLRGEYARSRDDDAKAERDDSEKKSDTAVDTDAKPKT